MKPMVMGAMLGAGLGLVQGKDPLKSALIGGATAGIGDKLMGAGSLFEMGGNLGADQLTSELATQGLGGMQPVVDGTMGAMNPETISMFTPDGTSFLGTQNSGILGLGNPMSNQYMDLATNTNLGAESVSNLNVPNTGLFRDVSGAGNKNLMQQGTDFITDNVGDMDANDAGLALQAYQMSNQPDAEIRPKTAPQVLAGKPTNPQNGLLAINVPRPNAVFQDPLSEAEKLRRLYT